MFKEITPDGITVSEIKKRIFAYTYCQIDSEKPSSQDWYGSVDTYILNLRLSGVYNESREAIIGGNEQDNLLNSLKYKYLPSQRFILETYHLTQEEFVRFVYQSFLGRESDPDGFKISLAQLQAGVTRIDVVKRIRNSEEAQNYFLNLTDCLNDNAFAQLTRRIYSYHRDHDLDLSDKVNRYQISTPRNQILREQQQFQKLHDALVEREADFGCADISVLHTSEQLTDEDFIRKLYLKYLKRESDLKGLQSQVAQLKSGASRSKVLFNLRTSTEAINMFITLTSHLDNVTFVEVAYRLFYREKVSSAQKQLDLEKLSSGFDRQIILTERKCRQSHHLPNMQVKDPNEQDCIYLFKGDRQCLYQQWQINDEDFIEQTDNLSNEEFIHQVFQIFLQRDVSQAELALHQQYFVQGSSRLGLLQRVRRSAEAANLFIQVTEELNNQQFLVVAYKSYFQKELDPTDKLVYLQFLERGNPRIDILN